MKPRARSMGQAGAESIIHRKAQVARSEHAAREMSAAKALRLSMAKSADTLFDLPLVVRTVEQTVVQLVDLEEAVGEDGMLILLDGPEGARGAVKVDLQFIAALIEAQLIGVVRASAAEDRPFTNTDAAISQPLINDVLERFEHTMQEAGMSAGAADFRFGDRVENGRMLALALTAPDYDVYKLTVDFGPGAKTGLLELFLPQRPPEETLPDADGRSALAAQLEENAMNAPVMLDAVIARIDVPLDVASAWQPGALLSLPTDALSEAHLLGAKGHMVAKVKLGQLNGFRAVRLIPAETDTSPDADEPQGETFAGELPELTPVVEGVVPLPESAPTLDLEKTLDQPPDLLEEALLGESDMPDLANEWSDLAGGDANSDIGTDLPDIGLPDIGGASIDADDGGFDMPPMAMAEISLDD